MGSFQPVTLPDLEQSLLAATALTLLASEGPEEMLQGLVAVLVPLVADYAGADVLEHGRLRQVGVTRLQGPGAERAATARASAPSGLPHVHEQMVADLLGRVFPEVHDRELRQMSRSDEHYEALKELGIRSWMCVPLVGEAGVLGFVTLGTVGPGARLLGERELAAVSDSLRTTAIGVERALLRRSYEAQRKQLEAVIEDLPIGVSVVEPVTERSLIMNRRGRELLGPVGTSGDIDRRDESGAPLPRER